MRYAILVHKDPGSSYGVTVPGLPGCSSGGDTLAEAFANAQEAIFCHIEGYLLEGQPIPDERPLEEHQANPDYSDGIWGFVDVDLSRLSEALLGKAVRVNITLPQHVVSAVDNAAAKSGETRSGFLAHAALRRSLADSRGSHLLAVAGLLHRSQVDEERGGSRSRVC